MKRMKYPDFEDHKKLHDALVVRLGELEIEFREGKPATTVKVMQFLSSWLLQHILEKDRDYAKYGKGGRVGVLARVSGQVSRGYCSPKGPSTKAGELEPGDKMRSSIPPSWSERRTQRILATSPLSAKKPTPPLECLRSVQASTV